MLDEDRDKLKLVLQKLESTTQGKWCVDRVRVEDHSCPLEYSNCLLGHVFDMGVDEKDSNKWCDWFTSVITTEYVFYPINDGKNPKYPQETPRDRCIQYVKNLIDGNEESVADYYDRFQGFDRSTPDKPVAIFSHEFVKTKDKV